MCEHCKSGQNRSQMVVWNGKTLIWGWKWVTTADPLSNWAAIWCRNAGKSIKMKCERGCEVKLWMDELELCCFQPFQAWKQGLKDSMKDWKASNSEEMFNKQCGWFVLWWVNVKTQVIVLESCHSGSCLCKPEKRRNTVQQVKQHTQM